MRLHNRILNHVVRQICSICNAVNAGCAGGEEISTPRPAVMETLESRLLLSTVTWSNLSGGDWNTASNWSGNKVPAAGDDAVINVAGGVAITYSTGTASVRSINSTDPLTISGGTLNVTGGTSLLSGGLTVSGKATLTVTGAGTTLTATGSTNVNGGNLTAAAGAAVALPGLTSYQAPTTSLTVVTLQATGTGSTLDLSHLTSLTGGVVFDAGVNIEALAGGNVNLTALPGISAQAFLKADGTGSVLDLSSLASLSTTSSAYTSGLTCTNSGHVLDGSLTTFSGPAASQDSGPILSLDGTGVISTSQITSMAASQINLSGGTPNFSGLTNFNASGATVSNGATLALPSLTSYQTPGTSEVVVTLEATGTASTLDLSHVAALSGPTTIFDCGTNIEALSGGKIELGSVPNITAQVFLESDGTNSVLDISSLASLSTVSDAYTSGLTCTDSGHVLDGKLTTFSGPAESLQSGPVLTIDATGIISTSQITSFTASQLNLSGVTPNFSGLTDFDASGATVSNGATLTLSSLTSYHTPSTSEVVVTLEATGSGSLLDMSHVTSLSGPTTVFDCGTNIEALAGGSIKLPAVPGITAQVFLEADGSGSVLDISDLAALSTVSDAYTSGLTCTNGGHVLDGKLTTFSGPAESQQSGPALTIDGTGVISTSQITSFTASQINITGGDPNFSGLIDFDASGATASNGSTLTLAGVTAYHTPTTSEVVVTLEATGTGSLLDLSHVITLTGPTVFDCGTNVEAMAGGHVKLSNLTTADAQAFFEADGAGSVQDLSKLTNIALSSDAYTSGFQASNSGVILRAPTVPTVGLVSSLNPSTYNQAVTFTATVTSGSGTPTGTVTFVDTTTGITLGTAALSGSTAALTTDSSDVLPAGGNQITATYNGDSNFGTASNNLTQAVDQTTATIVVVSSQSTSTYGQALTFTATVHSAAGTPTGTVVFQNNGVSIGSAVTLVNGVATSSAISTLHPGHYTITATYGGDTNDSSVANSTPQTVSKADQTIAWATPAAILTGMALSSTQLDATVSGVSGGSAPGTLTYSPVAGTFLAAGDQTLTVTAAATTDYNQATDSVILTVNPSSGSTPPVATLTANKLNILAGATETLTATVTSGSGTPTGSVTFFNGSTVLQTMALSNGTAVLNTSALAFGVHAVTFSYTGDGTYSGITSAAADIFVGQTAHQVIVNALYRQLLNRDAEETQGGLYYWAGLLDNGTPLSKVADGIATSVEYDTDIVTSIYQQYLHRNPDPTGLTNWVGQMQAGTVSYETIRGSILGSQEFENDVLAQYPDYVTGLYETLLGRAPDPTGLTAWTQILGAGSTDAQRDPVSIGISTSFEQYEDFVGTKFQQFLNRSPSAALAPSLPNANGVPAPTNPTLQGEQGFWADALNHGTTDGDFIADILSSTEYLNDQGLPTS